MDYRDEQAGCGGFAVTLLVASIVWFFALYGFWHMIL